MQSETFVPKKLIQNIAGDEPVALMNKIDEERALKRKVLDFFFHHVCLRTEVIMSSGYIDKAGVVPLAFLAVTFLKMGSLENARILMSNEHVLEQSEKDSVVFAEASKRGCTDIMKQLADRPGFEFPALMGDGLSDLESYLPQMKEPLARTINFYANHSYFSSKEMSNELLLRAADSGSRKVLKEIINDKRIDWQGVRQSFLESIFLQDSKVINLVLDHEQFASEDPEGLQQLFFELYNNSRDHIRRLSGSFPRQRNSG
jgi:hypothetical protein